MKKVVFFILAALAVLAWGCTKEVEKAVEEEPADVPETPEIPDADEPMVTVEFNADFDKTKTTLDDNSVVWEAGDKIVLFPMKYTDLSYADDETWTALKNETGSLLKRSYVTTGMQKLSDALVTGGKIATFTFTVSESDAEKIAEADYYVAFVYAGTGFANYAFSDDYKFNNQTSIQYSYFYCPFLYSQGGGFHHLAFAKNNGGGSLSFKNLNPVLTFTTNNDNAAKAIITDNDDNYIAGNYDCCSRSGSAYPFMNPRTKLSSAYTEYSYIEKNIVPGQATYITLHPYYSFTHGFTISIRNSSDEEIDKFIYHNPFTPTVGHITTITNFENRTEKPAVLKSGSEFNAAIKTLAAGTDKTSNDSDALIQHIVFATGSSATSETVISDGSSPRTVYAFWDSSTKTITISTAMSKIYMGTNASAMFQKLTVLKDISGLGAIDATSITSASYMFWGSSSITSITMPTTSSSLVMVDGMFWNCSALTTLDASNLTARPGASINNLFNGCSSITSIDLPATFDTDNANSYSNLFYGCTKLKTVYFRGLKIKKARITSLADAFADSFYNVLAGCNFYYTSASSDYYTPLEAFPEGTYSDGSKKPIFNYASGTAEAGHVYVYPI